MAATSTILLGAAAGLSLASAYNDSVAFGIQAEQEKTNAEINSRISKIRQEDAKKKGDEQLSKFRRDAKKFLGSQKTAMAASGVAVDSGSFQKIAQETEMLLIEDETRIKNNAMLEAWGYKTESENARLQGEYNYRALKNKAGATLLGGGLRAGLTAFQAFGSNPSVDDVSGGGGSSSFSQSRET